MAIRSRRPRKPPHHHGTTRRPRDIQRIGYEGAGWRDIYHRLMTVPVPALLLGLVLLYLATNLIFAFLYVFYGGIANARPGSVADAFFFSIQTMATVGYGNMYPSSFAANVLATIESLAGLLTVALTTGVAFARVSRPTARVMFSRIAVISRRNGQPTLMLRAANQRRNQVVEAQMTVSLLLDEVSEEGEFMRRFHDVELMRGRTPMFYLSWTVMHQITSASPFFGMDAAALAARNAELHCSISGYDEVFAQMVHARYAYGVGDIRWNSRFTDLLIDRGNGVWAIDYTRFHDATDLALDDVSAFQPDHTATSGPAARSENSVTE